MKARGLRMKRKVKAWAVILPSGLLQVANRRRDFCLIAWRCNDGSKLIRCEVSYTLPTKERKRKAGK